MLRAIVLFFVVVCFFSCETQDNEVLKKRSEKKQNSLKATVVGGWVEPEKDSAKWVFQKDRLKWKGFSHPVSFCDNRASVGQLVFGIVLKHPDSLTLINKTTKEKHILVRVCR